MADPLPTDVSFNDVVKTIITNADDEKALNAWLKMGFDTLIGPLEAAVEVRILSIKNVDTGEEETYGAPVGDYDAT